LSNSYDADYHVNIKKIESNSLLSGSEEQSQDYYQVGNQIYEDKEPLFSNKNIEIAQENYDEDVLEQSFRQEQTPEPLKSAQRVILPSPKPRQATPVSLIKTRKNEPLNEIVK
jgi:hypothetical protein